MVSRARHLILTESVNRQLRLGIRQCLLEDPVESKEWVSHKQAHAHTRVLARTYTSVIPALVKAGLRSKILSQGTNKKSHSEKLDELSEVYTCSPVLERLKQEDLGGLALATWCVPRSPRTHGPLSQ